MKRDVNATHYENIPALPPNKKATDRVVHVIIETVQGSGHKKALDAELGISALHQVLANGREWPYDYGFIAQTLADDGDPLDLLYLIDRPTFPGCMAQARILGSILLKKNGVENDRLIGAPLRMQGTVQSSDAYEDIADIEPQKLDAIRAFLVGYSADEGNEVDVVGVAGAAKAMDAVKRYGKRFKKKTKH